MAYSKKQLRIGEKIELEHGRTIMKFKKRGITKKAVARMIAKDHLREDPKYYSKLLKYVEKKRKR